MWISVALVAVLATVSSAVNPTTVLSQADQTRLKALFKCPNNLRDVETAHYAAGGLKLLEESPDQEICKAVQKLVDSKSLASVYHATSAAQLVGNCKIDVPNADSLLVVNGDVDAVSLYHAVAARLSLGLKIDQTAVASALSAVVKDSKASIASYGYAFMAASLLPPNDNLKPVVDVIEDVVNMADEIGGYLLQFLHYDQDGLRVTAAVVKGMFDLAAKSNSAPTGVKGSDVGSFANYFLRSKHTGSVADAFHILSALHTLANNKYYSPLVVSLASSGVINEDQKLVQVRATDLLDRPVKGVKVTIVSAGQEGGELISDEELKSVGNGLFEVKLNDKFVRGVYSFQFSAASGDKIHVDVDSFETNIQIVGKVSISSAEFAIVDADQGVKAKSLSLNYPQAISEKLSADHHQKLSLQFDIKDASGEVVSVHQSFVQLTHERTGQEIVFVAQADDNDRYKFDVNLGSVAGDSFNHQSGHYSMALTVGDSLSANPLVWTFGSIDLSFPGTPSQPKPKLEYGTRKEIKHLFRVPEKRPPVLISNVFTLLVLSPLLVLLIAWLRIGVNLNNIGKGSIFSVLFFVGLTAILLLYSYFWCASNMFTTLKGVFLLGVPTFVCGNKMLSNMAAQKR